MKKLRKLLSLSTALLLATASVTSLNVSAKTDNEVIDRHQELCQHIEQLKSEGKEFISVEEYKDLEMKYDTVTRTNEDGSSYQELIVTISHEGTNGEHIPLTYDYEIAWTKMYGLVDDWNKISAINGEMITPESGWYPLVNYFIGNDLHNMTSGDLKYTLGDIDSNGVVDLTDLTYLSLYLLKDRDFDEREYASADIQTDGEVNIADLAAFKEAITPKPVG
ncbi:MAG: dockerin type I repeat-containing protein [Oscillospiraceae bacterium]|nr:dockerin type I repeat-containing protein [Oscillospiraceae bacterium]